MDRQEVDVSLSNKKHGAAVAKYIRVFPPSEYMLEVL